jgi:hypothetical protein
VMVVRVEITTTGGILEHFATLEIVNIGPVAPEDAAYPDGWRKYRIRNKYTGVEKRIVHRRGDGALRLASLAAEAFA